jgi:hypothetical protein
MEGSRFSIFIYELLRSIIHVKIHLATNNFCCVGSQNITRPPSRIRVQRFPPMKYPSSRRESLPCIAPPPVVFPLPHSTHGARRGYTHAATRRAPREECGVYQQAFLPGAGGGH